MNELVGWVLEGVLELLHLRFLRFLQLTNVRNRPACVVKHLARASKMFSTQSAAVVVPAALQIDFS